MPVHFFKEDTSFNLKEKRKVKQWLNKVIADHNFLCGDINYIFCSDEHLLQINKDFLNHDYYTDIITFDQSDADDEISGDIYISVDRVKENSLTHGNFLEEEIRRVMVHGILHLLGFSDKTKEEESTMREKEEACLTLY